MFRILLYVGIISFGFLLSFYKLIPHPIKSKTTVLQTCALFFLLGIMGYKIGADDQILKEFPKLGLQAFVISIFSIIGSIFITKIFFKNRRG
nr:LysO family transporter [uncultured Cetobacterium sp.]